MRDFSDLQREALSVRKDIQTAYKLICDAKARYIKQKFKARSKKQTEESETLFKDLEPYSSKQEIQDSYGYGEFSINEYDRLIKLWEQREEYATKSKKFQDRVVEMLDRAASRLNEPYQDLFDEFDELNRENERNVQQSLLQ